MGLFIKMIRNRNNQRLAEAISTKTSKTQEEVLDHLMEIFRHRNAEGSELLERLQTTGSRISRWAMKDKKPEQYHFHAEVSGTEMLIGYSRPPSIIIEAAKKYRTPTGGAWIAALRYTTATQPSDLNEVTLELLRWMVDSNGVLQNRYKYEELLDDLFTAVTTETRN